MGEIIWQKLKGGEPRAPPIDLVQAQVGDDFLTMSFEPFHEGSWNANVKAMSQQYSNSQIDGTFSLRPATSQETMARVASGFGEGGEFDAKRDIFDSSWLQVGRVVKGFVGPNGESGVYLNVPLDSEGNAKSLKQDFYLARLNGDSSEGAIDTGRGYFQARDKSGLLFVPRSENFDSALIDALDGGTGLLEEMGKRENYPSGIYVSGFYDAENPAARVVELNSSGDRLDVDGDVWGSDGGYAFGVPVFGGVADDAKN